MSRRIGRFLVLIIFIQVSITSSQKNNDREFTFLYVACFIYLCNIYLVLLRTSVYLWFSCLYGVGVALQALKDAWDGTPDSWEDGSDPCGGTWVGITCTNSRVTSM